MRACCASSYRRALSIAMPALRPISAANVRSSASNCRCGRDATSVMTPSVRPRADSGMNMHAHASNARNTSRRSEARASASHSRSGMSWKNCGIPDRASKARSDGRSRVDVPPSLETAHQRFTGRVDVGGSELGQTSRLDELVDHAPITELRDDAVRQALQRCTIVERFRKNVPASASNA